MNRQEHQFRAQSIIDFFKANNENRTVTLNHFRSQNIPHRTINKVLKRYTDEHRVTYNSIPGRPATINTSAMQRKVLKKAKKDRSKSERVSACDLQISKSTYRRVKLKAGLKSRKKQKKPKYIKDQQERCKKGAAKLYRDSIPSGQNFFFIIDDETYVPMDPTQVPGDQYYMSDEEEETPVEEKTIQTGKFESKFLIWQAMAENGDVSEPFVLDCNVNAQIYLKECIVKRLLPFIRKKEGQRPILFWPDLASSHYAKVVTQRLEAERIKFVSKVDNPPNAPQLRPIERFWAICKRRYRELNKPANTIPKMTRIWKRISMQVASESGKNLFEHFRRNLRKCAEEGPLAV